jgi:TRAP-type C4-dicarboxylate transport system permease small subunit
MLAQFNRRLTSLCEAVAGAGVLVLALLVTITVFLRFVVGAPPHWAEELPRLVLVWATMLGAVACSHRGTHLNAGIAPLLLRDPRHRDTVERFNNLLLIALFCLLGNAGWDLARITMGQTTTALQLPAGILYLAVPVCCAALVLVHVGLLLQPRRAHA